MHHLCFTLLIAIPFTSPLTYESFYVNGSINMMDELQTIEDALREDFSSSHVLDPLSMIHNTDTSWME
ncbi:hypothetical protein XELAEV_18015913mg [Xenopus laevis]|uniref:Uncharacterized protein n=1 Tax=Xenopus laevis TaxID=8355 RepID=A0A974DLD8_XENLA|nr:hypothetical protein XELAEV_18015913mg [Xenopus laevis]